MTKKKRNKKASTKTKKKKQVLLLAPTQLGNCFVNFSGKGPFTGPNKALVNLKAAGGVDCGLDEITKSRVLNEPSLQSKQFHVIKCPRINLNYTHSNITVYK